MVIICRSPASQMHYHRLKCLAGLAEAYSQDSVYILYLPAKGC